MLSLHRAAGTFRRRVTRYIALTHFAKDRFVEGGLPEERIRVKPNFVDRDPGLGSGRGGYALFVGRLSDEKGIDVLLRGWQTIGARLPLRIAGDGPMQGRVERDAANLDGVTLLGSIPAAAVAREMADATAVIVPSTSYETFCLVAVEAFSVGTPVIASRLGALSEVVSHGKTGFLFEPNSEEGLVEAVETLMDQPGGAEPMRRAARREYETHFTADSNYRQLIAIYEEALDSTPTV